MKTALRPLPTIRSDLSGATSLLHRRLETRLPFATTDVAVYRRTLEAYYGFYLPLERLLADAAPRIAGIDWASRIKAPALRRDLRVLGLTSAEIDSLPLCQTLPDMHSQAHTLGVLYVIEGATLGGQALREPIKTNLDIDTDTGAAFMNVYGIETDALWRVFLACLLELHEPGDTAQAVAMAQQTFICFEAWLETSEVLL
ncbi:MAG: heme oxygenase [Pseudomonas sp.]|nr:heme oxygenase [Pseudomonas sp.]